jgi:hypothetical protein
MAISTITLTESEAERLRTLSESTGKTEEELLREALDLLTAQVAQQERRALLNQAMGIWKDRDDLPTLDELRSEMDRY